MEAESSNPPPGEKRHYHAEDLTKIKEWASANTVERRHTVPSGTFIFASMIEKIGEIGGES
jgi:hypothetical protein